ncbi:MAG: ABC transporter permease subunit [Oscillospiraceae bacterium]|nr:ABC transporter permease subunit [Oscillospiraceae bacterium]
MMNSGLSQTKLFDKRYKNILVKLGVFILWLLVWEAIYQYVGRPILVVSPLATFTRISELVVTSRFWLIVRGTTLRVIEGVLLAFSFGCILAVLTKRIVFLKVLFEPILGIFRAMPSASIIILALVWLPTFRIPVFIIFLVVTPIIWANIYEGLGTVDVKLLEMATLFKWSFFKKARYIYLPHLAPFVASALSTAFGQGFRTAIGSEVIARPPNSMGRMIYDARIYMQTINLFAWTIAVLVVSVLIVKTTTKLLSLLSNKLAGTTPTASAAEIDVQEGSSDDNQQSQ